MTCPLKAQIFGLKFWKRNLIQDIERHQCDCHYRCDRCCVTEIPPHSEFENPIVKRKMTRMSNNLLNLAVASSLGGFIASMGIVHAASDDLEMAPHRAFYVLELDEAEERSGVQAVSGRMVIEITGSACDGWAVNVRFANAFTVQRGEQRVLDNADSYFESGDGKLLRFSSRQYVNGKLSKETNGTARLDFKDGVSAGGDVKLKMPKAGSFNLPKNTIFPLAHTERLLKLARKGEVFDQVKIYDGDAEQSVYFTSSVIGKRKEALENASGALKALDKIAYWPINVSYYDSKTEAYAGGEQVPSHQVGFALFANGVSGDLTIDYGDFSLKGELSKLEMLEIVSCD
jgi:hypothetical protein